MAHISQCYPTSVLIELVIPLKPLSAGFPISLLTFFFFYTFTFLTYFSLLWENFSSFLTCVIVGFISVALTLFSVAFVLIL